MSRNKISRYLHQNNQDLLSQILDFWSLRGKNHRVDFQYCSFQNSTLDFYTFHDIWQMNIGQINQLRIEERNCHLFFLANEIERWDLKIADLPEDQKVIAYFIKEFFIEKKLFIFDCQIFQIVAENQARSIQFLLEKSSVLKHREILLVHWHQSSWAKNYQLTHLHNQESDNKAA